jgi:hypothetical protein
LLFISQLQAICDAPWFAHTFADVHESLSAIKRDKDKLRVALVAASLASMSHREDTEAGAAQTHVLYEALRTGGDRAEKIVSACVRDLTRLVERGAQSHKTEQPARVTPSAAKRRKRKGA